MAASIALVMAGGAAFAYWVFGGTGTGEAQTAANPASEVVVTQTAAIALAPGEQVNLAGLLTNPNNTDVKVGTLTAQVTGASKIGVAITDFSLTGNPVVVNTVIKKGTPVSWSGMVLRYANSAVSQDNAKNTTVSIRYTLTPFVEPPATGTFIYTNGVLTVSDVASWPTATGVMTVQAGDGLYVRVSSWAGDYDYLIVGAVNSKFNYTSAPFGYYNDGPLLLKRGGVFYPRTPAWTIG